MIDKKFKMIHDPYWHNDNINYGRWESNPDDILCCLEDEYYYEWYYRSYYSKPIEEENTYLELIEELKAIGYDF